MLKKILLRSVLGIVLIVLSIVLLFVVANWQDQSLRPEVQASLNWQPPKNMEDDNGYLILLGMNAKDGVDPLALGKRKLELELMRYESHPNASEYDPNSAVKHPDEQPFKKQEDEVCAYATTINCVEFYVSRSVKKEQEIIQARRVLSQHLNSILDSKDFIEVAPPFIAASIPPYPSLVHAMEIERMRAIRLIVDGQTEQGFAVLMKIAKFSQKWLENSTFLISHMLAIAMVQRDLRIADELLQRFPELASQHGQVQAWLGDFSEKKMNISRALNYEGKISLRMMHDLRLESAGANKSWWESFLFNLFNRPNSSSNLAYDWQQIWSTLADQSGRDYLTQKQAIQKKQDALLGVGIANLYLRDPITKILLSVSTPGYDNYIEKHFDTFAQINLLAMKMALIEKKIPSSAIPQFVQDHAKQYANPYDGKAIGWDAEKHQLFIEVRQESNQHYQKAKILRLDVPRFASAVGT